jgi:intermembrane space import and assembly protein 40
VLQRDGVWQVQGYITTIPATCSQRNRRVHNCFWRISFGIDVDFCLAAIQTLDESLHNVKESSLSTIDAIMEEKRLRQAQAIADQERKEHEQAAKTVAAEGASEEGEEGMEGLQGEADQQGAFNPETGEINWDCPCLGGMATGPCGEEFKAAFSCFVYSKEEPKGVDCIEKFK